MISRSDAVLERFRKLCLALPETTEAGSWGHPNFRAGRKTFAAYEWIDERPSLAFRLAAEDVDLLLRREGCFATPYGKGIWVSLWADGPLSWPLVQDMAERSYRLVALKRMLAALDGAAAPGRRAVKGRRRP